MKKRIRQLRSKATRAFNTQYGTPTNTASPQRVPRGSSNGSASAVAATLVEAGSLFMVTGRAMDDQQWMAYSKRLSRTAEVALFNTCDDKHADFDK